MIGRISGVLLEKQPPFLLIDVQGVGYEIQASMSTIYQLPELGQKVNVLTHLYVREDLQMLYGFYDEKERSLFRALIKISGVGPKMALTILSGMDPKVFIQCIEQRDPSSLIRLPGVGKKTAERLILEMSGRLKNSFAEEFELSSKLFSAVALESPAKLAEHEAISALISLGYKPQEASKAVALVQGEGLSSQELIRRALQGQVR